MSKRFMEIMMKKAETAEENRREDAGATSSQTLRKTHDKTWGKPDCLKEQKLTPGHEVEHCQYGSDQHDEKKNCKENLRHHEVTTSIDFNLEHLHEGRRDNIMWDFTQAVIFLAKRSMINYMSENRKTVTTRKSLVFLPVLLVMMFSGSVNSLTYCHAGSYYIPLKDGQHACGLCPPGTFMPHHDHQFTRCYNCMKIEDPMLEILISECTGKENTVIHCVSGYYRRLPMNPQQKERCEKCIDCGQHHLHTAHECQTYADTHCCMEENYMVAKNKDGVDLCHELPWLCTRGEYFDIFTNECKPCPVGTFMPVDYHVMKECMKCHSSSKLDLPVHSVILQMCNITHQDVFGCEDGYFVDHTKGRAGRFVGCSHCKRCDDDGMFEGRSCSHDHDTVCCPQPNMMVVDNPDGVQCTETITASTTIVSTVESPDVLPCPEGFCVYTSMSMSVILCVPCEDLSQFTPAKTVSVTSSNIKPERGNGHTDQPEEMSWSIVLFIVESGIVVIVLVICKVPCINRAVRPCTAWVTIKIARFHRHHPKKHCTRDGIQDDEAEPLRTIETNVQVMLPMSDSKSLGDERTTSSHADKIVGKHESFNNLETLNEVVGNKTAASAHESLGTKEQAVFQDNKAEGWKHTSALHNKKKDCKKNPGHHEFTPVSLFHLENVPEGHRDNLVWDFLQDVIVLTVRVVVNYTSKDRPDGYANSGANGTRDLRGLNCIRFGSGMVWKVHRAFTGKEGERCPCRKCKASPDKAKTQWGQFVVRTAKQVVFNDEECKYTRCDVGFDRDEDRGKCVRLDGVKIENSDLELRQCNMFCVTHDENVIKKMEEMVNRYQELRRKLDDKYERSGCVDMSDVPVICVSHPHGTSKHVTVGERRGQQKVPPYAWSYTTQTCPGPTGAPVFALGRFKDDVVSCRHSIHSGNRDGENESGCSGW